jgi:WhiB family redox-sensing transcriptional regulator
MREPRNYEAPLCAEVGGEWWFPDKEDNNIDSMYGKSICRRCEHQTECAEWGIYNERHGIWGGLVEIERRMIRRQRKITVREEDIA